MMLSMASVKPYLTTTTAWVLPKEHSSIAPDDVYSNKGESCDRLR